jgi:hypothetical protein
MANVKLNIPSHLDLPEYKTSSKIVNPDFHDYTWTIVAEFFDPSHAYTFEQQLIYDNWNNPLLLNGRYHLGEDKQFRNKGGKPGKPSPLKGKPNGKKGIPTGKPAWNKGKPSPKKGIPNGKKGIPNGPQQNPSGPTGPRGPYGPRGPQKNPAPEVECPHCGLVGRGGNMTRKHFDNCKMKVDYS